MRRRSLTLLLAALALGLLLALAVRLVAGRLDAPRALEPQASLEPGPRGGGSAPSRTEGLAPAPAPLARQSEEARPAPPPAELAAGEAELVVQVLGREPDGSQRPLERVALHVVPAEGPPVEVHRVSRSRARLGEAPATDEEGRASLVLPAGRAWRLRAVPRPGQWTGAEDRVRALAEGEHYQATLVVALGNDVVLEGRVLGGAEGAPLAGASVSVLAIGSERIGASQLARPTAARAQAVTDEGGRFALPATSWERQALCIQASGYAPRYLEAPPVPEEGVLAPLEVRLQAAAVLELVLRDDGGKPWAALEARVEVPAARLAGLERLDAPPLVRSTTSAAEGEVVLVDLPVDVALQLVLLERGALVYRHSQPLVLAAGERRRLALEVPAPGALVGRLVDQRGRPVAQHPVWLAPDEGEELRVFFAHERPLRESVSDAEGRFALPAVPAGRWWVGPAPLSGQDARALADRVAPLAQALEHDPGQRGEHELQVVRGLGLSGALRDPDGAPLAGVIVRASGLGTPIAVEAPSDEGGRFSLGPLVPGEFVVVARPGPELGLASPPPASFEAGRADLELDLLRAAAVQGRVHGAGASEGEVEVALVPEDPASAVGWRPTRTREGAFRYTGLPPGRYALVASRPDGRIAVLTGLLLEAGRELGGIGLDLERGARLSVRAEGVRERWLCEAYVGELLVDYAACAAGEDAELVVPAGPVRVLMHEPSGRGALEELELEAGRRKILRLRPR